MFRHRRIRWTCTFLLCLATSVAAAADVEFIVGDYTTEEGGSWEPKTSPLRQPFGIDFDSRGTMYIVELNGGRVHRLSESGELTQMSGDGSKSYRGDGGPARLATFNGMHNCAVTSDDKLLIADSWNHCVRRIDLETSVIDTVVGTGKVGFGGDGGDARQATFNFIMCIALNVDRDELHVVDLKNRRVRNVDLASGMVQTVAGNGQKGAPTDGSAADNSPLVDPRAAASDSQGNLYVLERGGHALRMVRPDGTIQTVAGTGVKGHQDGEAAQAAFNSPKHICCDDEDNVYIADDMNAAIRRYLPALERVETILGNGVGDTRIRLSRPHGVCFHKGSLYVIDSDNNRILRMVP